jgi:hypothetical protein
MSKCILAQQAHNIIYIIQTRDENVWWIVSKVDTGTEIVIQVVLSDNGDGDNAVKVAYKLKEELQKGTFNNYSDNLLSNDKGIKWLTLSLNYIVLMFRDYV